MILDNRSLRLGVTGSRLVVLDNRSLRLGRGSIGRHLTILRGLRNSLRVVGGLGSSVLTMFSLNVVNQSLVLSNYSLKLTGSHLGVRVRDRVANSLSIQVIELTRVQKLLNSLDILLKNDSSALKILKLGFLGGISSDGVIDLPNIGSIDVDTGVFSLKGVNLLAQLLNLSVHVLGLEGKVLTIELEGSGVGNVFLVGRNVVDGLNVDILLVVFHIDDGVLGDDSGGHLDLFGDSDIDGDLLNNLDLSVDDNIVGHRHLNLVVDEFGLLDPGHDLNVDDLLGDYGLLNNHIDRNLNLDHVISLNSVGSGHSDGDMTSLRGGGGLGHVVLDVLVLLLGGDSHRSANLESLSLLVDGFKTDGDIGLGGVSLVLADDVEPLDGNNVSDGMLLTSMSVDGLVIFDSGGVGGGVTDHSLLLEGVGLVGVLVSSDVVLDGDYSLDLVVDLDSVSVGLGVVAVGRNLILNHSLGGDSDGLKFFLEVVDGNVGDTPDHIDLVLGYLDHLLLGAEADISLQKLVDLVLSLEVLEFGDVDFSKFLVGGFLGSVAWYFVEDDLVGSNRDLLVDVLDLLHVFGLGDADNLLDVVLDDLLDYDFLDLLNDDLLLHNVDDGLDDSDVDKLVDVGDFGDLSDHNFLDRHLNNLLNNFLLVGNSFLRTEMGSVERTALFSGVDDSFLNNL